MPSFVIASWDNGAIRRKKIYFYDDFYGVRTQMFLSICGPKLIIMIIALSCVSSVLSETVAYMVTNKTPIYALAEM